MSCAAEPLLTFLIQRAEERSRRSMSSSQEKCVQTDVSRPSSRMYQREKSETNSSEQIPRRKMSCPEFTMRSPRLCFSKRAAKFEIHELRRWFAVHRLPLASAKRRTLRPLSLRPSQYAPSYVQIEHFDDLLFGMEKTGRFSAKFQHNFQFNSREYGYRGINIY